MTNEVQRGIEFKPGDALVIERGSHAGWCVRRAGHPGISENTAFFTDAKDMLEYLALQVQVH